MRYFAYVTIRNPLGFVIAHAYSKKGHINAKEAFKDTDRISMIYLHGGRKIPIGSTAEKEVLEESDFNQKMTHIRLIRPIPFRW